MSRTQEESLFGRGTHDVVPVDHARIDSEASLGGSDGVSRSNARIALVLACESFDDRLALVQAIGLPVETGDGAWKATYDPEDVPSLALDVERRYDRPIRASAARDAWRTAWRGLPAFEPATDRFSLDVECGSEKLRDELTRRLGVTIAKKTRGTWSAWWPPRGREDLSSLRFESDSATPRYPVYVPSKGRYDAKTALTIRALQRGRIPFYVVVEPQEEDAYRRIAGSSVLVLPFSNLGQGSIPSRCWIRDHAISNGHARHWQLDDNIIEFRRLWKGRRIPCDAGVALRVCEDLTDRFSNVGVSGLNYQMFVPAECDVPFYENVHVYSATLVSHRMPFVWRMRYNEDTDLCLQALVGGYSTLLLNAFMANKMRTMAMKGGNTDELYAGDGRYTMARYLERQWPGLVSVRWKFGRPQHSVDWGKFKDDPRPLLRPDVDLSALPDADEYGLRLRQVKRPKAESLRALAEEFG